MALIQGIGYAEATQQHYRDIEIAFTGADTELRADGSQENGNAPARLNQMLDRLVASPTAPRCPWVRRF